VSGEWNILTRIPVVTVINKPVRFDRESVALVNSCGGILGCEEEKREEMSGKKEDRREDSKKRIEDRKKGNSRFEKRREKEKEIAVFN
jgi:hypothetical protein